MNLRNAITAALALLSVQACATSTTSSARVSESAFPSATPTARSVQSNTEEPVTEVENPWEKFSFSAGGIVAALKSDVRFGPSGVGVSISPEDLLGFDSATTSARIGGSWRFSDNRKHRLDVTWFDLGRSGTTTLGQDLDFGGGNVIPAGSTIESSFGMSLIKTDYSYSFFQDDRFDLAGSGGFYVAPIDFTLAASGFSNFSDNFKITAPLPVIGLRMDFAVTPKWYLRSGMSLFYLEIGDYRGSMSDFTAAVEYKAWKHVAFGLGIDNFSLNVERNGSTSVPGVNFTGEVNFGYFGLMLYMKGLW